MMFAGTIDEVDRSSHREVHTFSSCVGLADATRVAHEELAALWRGAERGVEGRVLRLLGDIASHPDGFDFGTAEEHYRRAQALADEQGLRPLLAHCHFGLGKLYRRAGKPEHARAHLVIATTMYREMTMACWLAQAEAESETWELG